MTEERNTFEPTGRGPFIQTFSGGRFYYREPLLEEIRIEDIAHAIAHNCRYNGHTRDFYSVAEHCILGSYMVPEEDALAFLLHDANEAYLTDIPSPMKAYLMEHGVAGNILKELEARYDELIYRRFGLPWPMPATVKEADLRMLKTEVEQIMSDPADYRITDIKPYPLRIECLKPAEAEAVYLDRFHELYRGE